MSTYNERRAKDGFKSLELYQANRAEPENFNPAYGGQFIDLLTDILHAAHRCGHNAQSISDLAYSHFINENEDESLNKDDGSGPCPLS